MSDRRGSLAEYDAMIALGKERDAALAKAKHAIVRRYYNRLHALLDSADMEAKS